MYSASISVCYIGLMFVMWWRNLLTAGLDLREQISRLSGFRKCGRATDKWGAQTCESGGSSLSIPETILLVYYSPSNSLVLRRRGLKHM
jgi:hypothetical protein